MKNATNTNTHPHPHSCTPFSLACTHTNPLRKENRKWGGHGQHGTAAHSTYYTHCVVCTRYTPIIIAVLQTELRAPHPHSSTINNAMEKRGKYKRCAYIRTCSACSTTLGVLWGYIWKLENDTDARALVLVCTCVCVCVCAKIFFKWQHQRAGKARAIYEFDGYKVSYGVAKRIISCRIVGPMCRVAHPQYTNGPRH